MAEGLTDKQQRFVDEYLIDLNGKQAAIRAGYSEHTAEVQASRLLSNAKVSEAVEKGKKSVAEKLGITHERVLKEFSRLAFLDIRKAFDGDGNLIPIHELDDDTAAAVAGLEVEVRRTAGEPNEEMEPQPHGGALKRQYGSAARLHKIKLSDKKAALDSLAKHLGLLSDKINLNANLNLTGGVNVYLPTNGRDETD